MLKQMEVGKDKNERAREKREMNSVVQDRNRCLTVFMFGRKQKV